MVPIILLIMHIHTPVKQTDLYVRPVICTCAHIPWTLEESHPVDDALVEESSNNHVEYE